MVLIILLQLSKLEDLILNVLMSERIFLKKRGREIQ
jgi:hypothetical protein